MICSSVFASAFPALGPSSDVLAPPTIGVATTGKGCSFGSGVATARIPAGRLNARDVGLALPSVVLSSRVQVEGKSRCPGRTGVRGPRNLSLSLSQAGSGSVMANGDGSGMRAFCR